MTSLFRFQAVTHIIIELAPQLYRCRTEHVKYAAFMVKAFGRAAGFRAARLFFMQWAGGHLIETWLHAELVEKSASACDGSIANEVLSTHSPCVSSWTQPCHNCFIYCYSSMLCCHNNENCYVVLSHMYMLWCSASQDVLFSSFSNNSSYWDSVLGWIPVVTADGHIPTRAVPPILPHHEALWSTVLLESIIISSATDRHAHKLTKDFCPSRKVTVDYISEC